MECKNGIFIGDGLKVLLVDSDLNSLEYMSKILREHSYRVTTATMGFVALSMLVTGKFDLVICEIDLPGVDGYDFLKQITSRVDIPILLISAREDTQLASKAAMEGACFFYHKPIAPQNLVNIWRHFFTYSLENNKLDQGLNPTDVEKFLHGVHGKGKSSSPKGTMPLPEPVEVMSNGNEPNEIGESSQLSKEKKEVAATVTIKPTSSKKKERSPRIKWTPELQHKFQRAFEAIGKHRAIPSKLIKLMRHEPGIKVQHINSYLQKYRKKLKEQKQEATETEMPTNNSGATGNGILLQNPSPVLGSQRSLGAYPSSVQSSLAPDQFNPHYNISRPSYVNNQTPGNLVQYVVPNNYIQTTQPPNMFNVRNYAGLGGFVSTGTPQLLPELNGGLGMEDDDDIYLSICVTGEDIEEALQKVPDIIPGSDASSPEGNVSGISVTRPLTPQIGTVTGGDNLAEEDVNAFVDSLIE